MAFFFHFYTHIHLPFFGRLEFFFFVRLVNPLTLLIIYLNVCVFLCLATTRLALDARSRPFFFFLKKKLAYVFNRTQTHTRMRRAATQEEGEEGT